MTDTPVTETMPCANCGGPLEFDPGVGALACKHCGATPSPAVAGAAAMGDLPRWPVEATLSGQPEHAASDALALDVHEIRCSSCGGETLFTGNLTSTRCPYCATPVQRTDVHDAPDRLKVDTVVPFAVTEAAAREHVETWIRSRRYAPSAFKQHREVGAFESVYLPFFGFLGDTTTKYRGDRGRIVTRTRERDGRKVTEQDVDWTPVQGTIDVHTHLAVPAVELDVDVDALAPWPADDIRPYDSSYLAGHLCRAYSRDLRTCSETGRERIEADIRASVEADIGGDRQRIDHLDTEWHAFDYQHVLHPLWLLTVRYRDRPYQLAINGATGKVTGERPYSRAKILATIVAVLALVAGLAVWATQAYRAEEQRISSSPTTTSPVELSSTIDCTGSSEPCDLGDDDTLDSLHDACTEGSAQACDDLYEQSPIGSRYEAYGYYCGDRLARPKVCDDDVMALEAGSGSEAP